MSAGARALPLLSLLVAGCGASTHDGAGDVDTTGASSAEEGDPARSVEAQATPSADAITCGGELPEPPQWALTTGRPVPDRADLTGQWTEVPLRDPSVGPVSRELSCVGGESVLTLEQRGTTVRAVWFFRERMSGARRVTWERRYDAASGTIDAGRMVLTGIVATVRGRVESPATRRDCRPTRYELAWDEPTGNLVGMRDGAPIRLAPLLLTARSQPCGAPPP